MDEDYIQVRIKTLELMSRDAKEQVSRLKRLLKQEESEYTRAEIRRRIRVASKVIEGIEHRRSELERLLENFI